MYFWLNVEFYYFNKKQNEMDAKKFAIGTLAGGVAFFLLGWLLYGMLFMNFFEANAGSATGVNKESMNMIALFLGNLAMAALFTLIFLRWANISTFVGGLKGGALIGLLVALGLDLTMFGTTNLMTLNGMVMDVVVYTVMSAVAGGVIGWLLGMGKKA